MLGDMCAAASLARLSVEVITEDGKRVTGVPSPHTPVDGDEVDHTGYANELLIDGQSVRLDTIVEITVRTVADAPPP